MINDINVKIQKVKLLSIRLNKKKLAYEYCSETEGHQRKTDFKSKVWKPYILTNINKPNSRPLSNREEKWYFQGDKRKQLQTRMA